MNDDTTITLTTSNSTAITVTTSSPGGIIELWFRIWLQIIQPDIVIFGMITNPIIFLLMPRSAVTVGPSAKIYYVTIAISDFINLSVEYMWYTLISDSMYAFI